MNVLTFSVMAAAVLIFLTWMVNDVIPQILYNRKLDKTAKEAEESRRRFQERSNEITQELTVPTKWVSESTSIANSRGWVGR